jgi:ATP-dependent RNA helicase RhlE
MLDMGFINDVRKIINMVPKKRQTMLFSATISKEVKALSAGILQDPVTIQVGKERNPIETITQHIYPVEKDKKFALLLHLIDKEQMESVLIFSRTKHGADKITKKLKHADISAEAIHSGRNQRQREKSLADFKRGKTKVMVATDIAARGIDIDGISHVINYDVPLHAEDYIHRIGRTGRAEAKGDAITFVSHEEEKYFRKIEYFIERKLKPTACEGYTYIMIQPRKKTAIQRWPKKRRKRTRK